GGGGERGVAGQSADCPGAGQGGQRSPGSGRQRQQADAAAGRDQHRRMAEREVETALEEFIQASSRLLRRSAPRNDKKAVIASKAKQSRDDTIKAAAARLR